jgi:hypothetical protein
MYCSSSFNDFLHVNQLISTSDNQNTSLGLPGCKHVASEKEGKEEVMGKYMSPVQLVYKAATIIQQHWHLNTNKWSQTNL